MMKIHWHENPFLTIVELDDRDKEHLLLTYQRDQYEDILFDIEYYIDNEHDINYIKKKLSRYADICNLVVDSEIIQNLIDELNYPHTGDCTCDSISCIRCKVEDMVGIDTIKGLGPHAARRVKAAYGDNANRTIDHAIVCLEKVPVYERPDTWPNDLDYDAYIPKWENDRQHALTWLKQYKQEHQF